MSMYTDAEDDHMLTTVDNPYNPFTHFDDWLGYDRAAGYNTTEFLARIANYSDELSDVDQNLEIERAIREIVEENVSGMYRMVTRDWVFEESDAA